MQTSRSVGKILELPENYCRWVQVNHVKMATHLLPQLESHFHSLHSETSKTYPGIWHYLQLIGSSRGHMPDDNILFLIDAELARFTPV